jgi:hypothetical protein
VRSGSGRWTARYEIERLTQLRADIQSASDRYMTECIRSATKVSDYDAEMWMRKAGNTETARDNMIKDVDRWITEWCRRQDEPDS